MSNKAEFLTTIEKWDLMELLARLGDGSNVLVAIEIHPRHGRAGFLEEKGRWVHEVWSAALTRIPEVAGHRMMWSQVLFVCKNADIRAAEDQFAEILCSCRTEELRSLCVLSIASGGAKAKLAVLDRMFAGVAAEWNFGDPTQFDRWLLDGERYIAASPSRTS